MRKLIFFNMVSLEGYFAGPQGELDWHRVDEEFNEFAIAQLNSAGGLIFGRKTYTLMASYWPTSAALLDDPVIAGQMNQIAKIVASRTLETAEWNNTRLVKNNLDAEILKLKQQPGGDLFIFGSANLALSLMPQQLIDEYRLIVAPLILGRGRPLFAELPAPLPLTLQSTRLFRNGNVLLTYQPAAGAAGG